jgi:hypothetical protein
LRIDRFEPVRRRYGPDHVVDEAVLHAMATGTPSAWRGGAGRCGPVSCTSSTSTTA